MFQSAIALIKKENLYRIYCLLVLAAVAKQMVEISVLVDWEEYRISAQNLLQNQNLDSSGEGTNPEHWLHLTRRTLGFPLLIILSFCSPYVMVLLQLLPAFLVPVCGKNVIEKMGLPEATLKQFLLLLLLYPLQFFYAALPMPEIWCQLLILQSTLWFLDKKWSALSFAVAALVLLKPVFLIMAIALCLYGLLSLKKRYWLLLPMVIIVLISTWNYALTNRFHYTSVSVENAWEYNQRAVLNRVMTDAEQDNYFAKHDSLFRASSFAEQYDIMQKETKKNIGAHWKLYAWLHLKGAALAALDPGRYDLVAFLKLSEGTGFMGAKKEGSFAQKIASQPWYILCYMGLLLLVNVARWILVTVALIYSYRKWILPFAVVLVFVGVTGPVGSARYLFPFMPLVCLMAAHGWQLWLWRNEKNITAE